MKKVSSLLGLVIVLFSCITTNAQDLLKGIEDSLPVKEKVFAAFKSTRVINAHSVEMLPKGTMDFRILHRFDPVSRGGKEFFGLDHANMRIGVDYGLTDNLMFGIGRTTYFKEYDAFIKARVFQQTRGPKSIPFSLLFAVGATDYANFGTTSNFSDRFAYYVQMIAGRKFSSKFSLQLSPILLRIHGYSVSHDIDSINGRTIFALGGGLRFKVSRRIALTLDYHHPFTYVKDIYTDPISFGIDIETGGHVFQLHFSNTIGMNERVYLTNTLKNSHPDGGIRFGFNLSRVFKLRHHTM